MLINRQLWLIFAVSAVAWAQPAPVAVYNPASNIPAGLPNAGVAQGSIFVIYGTNMGPAAIVQPSALPLPTTAGLGGTTVTVTVGGTTVTAPMIYSLNTQVAAVLPSTTPLGTGTVTVTYNGMNGTTPIQVVASNFGISTVNQTGAGPGIVTTPSYALITATNSAKPGDNLVLWGTGLGPITGSDAVVPNSGDLGTAITVYVGGVAANILYRGRSGAPGLDQINFTVPAGVSGCSVSLVVQTKSSALNTVSNATTMPIAAGGGTCSDPNGVSLSSLAGPLSKGAVNVGGVTLSQITTSFSIAIPGGQPISQTNTTTAASASFTRFTAAQISQNGSLFTQASIGSCTVVTFHGTTSPPSQLITATGLDAGSAITVNTAAGSTLSLTPLASQKGVYSASNAGTLTAGTYKASNGSGGADVGAFTASLNLTQPPTWTNQAAITGSPISRSTPLNITWSGADPNGSVEIFGVSTSGTGSAAIGVVFTCFAPSAAGQFAVPTTVLLALPPSTTASGIPTGLLLVGATSQPAAFTAPGLDLGYFSSSAISGSLVSYQ